MTNSLQNKNTSTSATLIVNQAIDEVTKMLKSGVFDMPENYSFKNAIQQSRYLLQEPDKKGKSIIDKCDPQSILNSVMEMAQKGLNPSKKQCYFIPYGGKCTLSISYQGNVAMAKRSGQDIGDVYGYAIYKDDEFELGYNLQKGITEITKYVPDVTKWTKNNIVGAVAVITDCKGVVKYTEYMTMEQIKDSWNMGYAKGDSKAHNMFPDQQAIKTVKNRAVKSFVNTSDDGEIMSEDDKLTAYVDESFNEEKESEANLLELDTNSLENNEEAQFEEVKYEKKEIPSNVDSETGEVLEEDNIEGQSDFFDSDFEALDKAPF
ncbi:recombinase RecT [Anaerococcus sp. AGMB00486]|uniref:Recombinase RecT n=1 Tax=Anaerococcus faecalis TaxID=2742993 RepID=A0ABX2N7Z9_9FIRM|nr:RecT family recombinase [Anaerococcus faecalis]NVF10795.1 recombinase RecT [Anaerococcus faecalis]